MKYMYIYICIQLKRQMLTLVHVFWTPVDRFLYCCQVCEFCTVLLVLPLPPRVPVAAQSLDLQFI